MVFTCRLCGIDGDERKHFIHLFDKSSKSASDNLNFIKTHLCIWVGSEDFLPQFICEECWAVNDHFLHYLEKCQATQYELQKRFWNGRASGSKGKTSMPTNVSASKDTTIEIDDHENTVTKQFDNTENNDTANIGQSVTELITTDEEPKLGPLNIDKPVISDVVESNHEEIETEMQVEHASSPQEQNFQCTICKLNVNNREALSNHFRCEHEDMRLFSCHKCDYVALTLERLSRHLKQCRHRNFKCSVCHDQFRIQSNLTAHFTDMHTDGKPMYCTLCGKIFKQKYKFLKHEMLVHKVNERWVCKVCTQHFDERILLESHMKTHYVNKKVKCRVDGCQFSTRNKQKMTQHKKKCMKKISSIDNAVNRK